MTGYIIHCIYICQIYNQKFYDKVVGHSVGNSVNRQTSLLQFLYRMNLHKKLINFVKHHITCIVLVLTNSLSITVRSCNHNSAAFQLKIAQSSLLVQCLNKVFSGVAF